MHLGRDKGSSQVNSFVQQTNQQRALPDTKSETELSLSSFKCSLHLTSTSSTVPALFVSRPFWNATIDTTTCCRVEPRKTRAWNGSREGGGGEFVSNETEKRRASLFKKRASQENWILKRPRQVSYYHPTWALHLPHCSALLFVSTGTRVFFVLFFFWIVVVVVVVVSSR